MDDNPYRPPRETEPDGKPRLRWRFRRPSPYSWLLWLVLLVTVVAMVAIGWAAMVQLPR
ncbi:MAG TPA: hypothetical protein VMY37_20005 [Thermoguttaceae bacterium]|nr:hypothetical protein [Thermoguttaceae bacterium]